MFVAATFLRKFLVFVSLAGHVIIPRSHCRSRTCFTSQSAAAVPSSPSCPPAHRPAFHSLACERWSPTLIRRFIFDVFTFSENCTLCINLGLPQRILRWSILDYSTRKSHNHGPTVVTEIGIFILHRKIKIGKQTLIKHNCHL